MDTFRYEVDENNTIRLWAINTANENDAPTLIQPEHPSNRPWQNKQEAITWIEDHLVTLAEEEAKLAEEKLLKESSSQEDTEEPTE